MTTVQDIGKAIRQLSHEELAQLKQRIADYEWEKWDKQLERDVKPGRLYALAQEALQSLKIDEPRGARLRSALASFKD
jgi:hypothetical protein